MTRFLDEMRQDARHAARTLVRHPSFTAAAVLSLALGIGANTAIFSVFDATVLRPLPYAEPGRLIAIHGTSSTTRTNSVSYPNFLDVRARTRTFEEIAAWRIEMFTLAGQPQAERLIGGRVSASYFSILRVPPLVGRTFAAREDQPGGPAVVLLGERLWRRRFAADTRVVGQPVTLDGKPYTVIGVMPAHVGVGVIRRLYDDVFLPIGQYDDELFLSRHVNAAAAIGRLRPGVGLAEARAEMDTIATSLAAAYPEANKGVGVNAVPLEDDLVGDLQPTLMLLLAAVTFVLLIACANVSNLILARFTRRSQEFAVRAALGAGRARILRQALTESVCLAFAGGAVGVVLAAWGTRAALSLDPVGIAGHRERRHELACAAGRGGRRPRERAGVCRRAGPSRHAAESQSGTAAERARGQLAPSPRTARVPRHPGRADADAPRRRGSHGAQPGPRVARRPGIRSPRPRLVHDRAAGRTCRRSRADPHDRSPDRRAARRGSRCRGRERGVRGAAVHGEQQRRRFLACGGAAAGRQRCAARVVLCCRAGLFPGDGDPGAHRANVCAARHLAEHACRDRRRGVRSQRLPWPGSDRPAHPSRRDRRAGRGDRRRRSSEALGPRRGWHRGQRRAGAGVCSGRATARQPRTARRQRIQRRGAVIGTDGRRARRRCEVRCASTTAARS